MDEESALLNLSEEYSFSYFHFDAPIAVTRVIVQHGFSATGMDGRKADFKTFYFEVHKTLNRQPVVYFPSDSCVPNELSAKLGRSTVVFPAPVKRILGKDMFSRSMTFPVARTSKSPSADQVQAVLEVADVKRNKFRVKADDDAGISGRVTRESQPRKFKITKIEGEVEERKIQPIPLSDLGLISSNSVSQQHVNQIAFCPTAIKKILTHIDYGKKTESNIVEQGGVYIGIPCVLPDGEKVGIVETAISAPDTRGTSTYVEFNHDAWKFFMDELDSLKEQKVCGADSVILGWYHTHPNSLDVFMSGTDLGTQREQFYRDWNSALVINPHRKLIAGFYGRDATPAEVFVFQH